MTPRVRKLALTAHVVSSVGWLGAVAAFLALGITALATGDAQLLQSVYLVAPPITWFVIVPFALASLLTGVVQSLGTHWGLVRHYWVIFKLVIAVGATIVLLMYADTVDALAEAAQHGATANDRPVTFVLHSGVALVLLLIATALAVYKPRGMTPHGWRKERNAPNATQRRGGPADRQPSGTHSA